LWHGYLKRFDTMNQEDKLYFLALLPDEQTSRLIESIKREIKDKYGFSYALRLPAHITLQAPFRCSGICELNMKDIVKKVGRNNEKFTLNLAGISHYEERVLFAGIQEDNRLNAIHHSLQSSLMQSKCLPLTQLSENFNPHMTLAYRDIDREQFDTLWSFYKHKELKSSFEVIQLGLYKHGAEGWELVTCEELIAKPTVKKVKANS